MKGYEEEEEEVKEEKSGNMRIKIVLTKEELEWLMLELKKTEGRRIEELLEEIQRSRERSSSSSSSVANNWKPSLDSITEIPDDEGMER